MTRPTRGEHGDERRTNHNAERIGADDMSGAGYRNSEVSGNIRKQPHHDELARADTEASDGERQFRPSAAARGYGCVVCLGDHWTRRLRGRDGIRISRVVPRISIETADQRQL